jgi:hypothetical protein
MATPVGKPLGETPFDDDVREWAQDLGLSLNQARDRFILVALQMGNAQPLSVSYLGVTSLASRFGNTLH